MKLCVIGGGGVRSMFLARSIAGRAAALGIQTLVFMDNDAEKLKLFGGMAKHVAHVLAPHLQFVLTTDAQAAVTGADYVITTIRVGGDAARSRDEHIALRKGVLGQETTGAAGFSFAMRSIPVLLEYCALIREHAKPTVKVFNFTNPVGIVSQALRDAGYDFTYGICDAPSSMLGQFIRRMGVDSSRVSSELFGLNHLSWFHQITLDGQDVMQKILREDDLIDNSDMRFFDKTLLLFIGCVPNEYLYYFYYREQALEHILQAGRTRGDDICEINEKLLAALRTMDTNNAFDDCLNVFNHWYGIREDRYMATETGSKRKETFRFDPYAADTGGYAGVALRFMEIIQSAQKGEMILCLPNNGAVSFLLDSDVVEATCDVTADGAAPHRFSNIPAAQAELIRRVKYYERLGAYAILRRDRKAAVESLMLHPLINSYSIARELVSEYIQCNQQYTGNWSE